MNEEELKKIKEELAKEVKEQFEKEYEQKISDLNKEIHSYKSQAGDYKKQLETIQNNGKTLEELLQAQLDAKEKEAAEKEAEIETLKSDLRIKELETKKAELVKEHKVSEEFTSFIAVNASMKDEDLETLVKGAKNKEDAFKANLLKDYSITDTNNTNKKDDDYAKELAKKANKTIPEDTWK